MAGGGWGGVGVGAMHWSTLRGNQAPILPHRRHTRTIGHAAASHAPRRPCSIVLGVNQLPVRVWLVMRPRPVSPSRIRRGLGGNFR